MPPLTGVIGALGVVAPPRPTLSRGLGDVGLICWHCWTHRHCSTADIIQFFEQDLGPMLNPFPGPRSVVIMDNAPGHTERLTLQAQQRITTAVQRRGALLIWLPSSSPDLNPIENHWNAVLDQMAHREISLYLGELGGPPRPFVLADLTWCLTNTRQTREALRAPEHQAL